MFNLNLLISTYTIPSLIENFSMRKNNHSSLIQIWHKRVNTGENNKKKFSCVKFLLVYLIESLIKKGLYLFSILLH